MLRAIVVLWVRGRLESVLGGHVLLLGVLISAVTHKIKSLQYGVWIAAMTAAALALAGSRAMNSAILPTQSLLVADRVIWVDFVPFISGNQLLLGYQGLRLGLLVVALIWLAVIVLETPHLTEEAHSA